MAGESVRLAGRAVGVNVRAGEVQGYLQRYPFATGPDAVMNRRGRAEPVLELRPEAAGHRATMLRPEETQLTPGEQAVAERLMNGVGIPADARALHLDDFGWEVNLVPRTSRKVLVVGCGDGVELLFLRAVLPQAELTAVDYHSVLLPGLADAAGVALHQGDLNLLLPQLATDFDLVFSNHTMEHLYDPETTLRVLRGRLQAGGCIVSTMPMHGLDGSPFIDEVRATVISGAAVHPLDYVFLDLGHPWKTNPADMAATLDGAGFVWAQVFQRAEHLSRALAMGAQALAAARQKDIARNVRLLGPLRAAIRAVFPRNAPEAVLRGYFALERLVGFGVNLVMNAYTEEGLFRAFAPSDESRSGVG